MTLPDLFVERLHHIVPEEIFDLSLSSLSVGKQFSFRINTLKTEILTIHNLLKENDISFDTVDWCPEAVIISNGKLEQLEELELMQKGHLYQQGLSSMLVPVLLAPKPKERLLDLCAAPGSKTSQLAAMMRNNGEIICVEKIKKRFYKLKSVLLLLNVSNTRLQLKDGRKYRDHHDLFDRILVDAPCSSEGLFNPLQEKTFQYWSPRKIKEMVKKQRGLLFNGVRLLKIEGTLIYSTCTFAPEENEGVINWLLKKLKNQIDIVPLKLHDIKTYPTLKKWKNKEFHPDISRCVRITPNGIMKSFFIAKLVKRKSC